MATDIQASLLPRLFPAFPDRTELNMMVAKTLLKPEGQRLGAPDQILFCVNNILVSDNDSGMFATVFCAILNTETGFCIWLHAGYGL